MSTSTVDETSSTDAAVDTGQLVEATKATRDEQKALTQRLMTEAESLAQAALKARRERGMPDPDPEMWGRRWLNYVHAREFLHVAMMIPGTNLHAAPHTLAEMLAHPITGEPATVPEMIAVWRFTTPLACYQVPWWPTEGHDLDDLGFTPITTLDIPDLGQVHESIMNSLGVIPEEDSVEIAKNGKRATGVWLATEPLAEWQKPHLVSETIAREVPVKGRKKPKIVKEKHVIRHPAGQFCILPGGTNRERSASFYTPQVLATFTVRQGIDVWLEENPDAPAKTLLELKICEPSVGTGSILVQGVRLVAEEYLRRRQDELGEKIPESDYLVELQKTKNHVARNQAWGVDLNENAVMIAELTLWADSLIPEMVA